RRGGRGLQEGGLPVARLRRRALQPGGGRSAPEAMGDRRRGVSRGAPPRAGIEAYAEAVRLDSGNADYVRNLGVAQHQAGDPRAAESFERALTLRPGDPDLLDGLGLALVDAVQADAAVRMLRLAVSARPENPVYHYHLARGLERAGNPAGAAAEYRESIRLAPGVPVPYRALGLLLDRQGDSQGALSALERAEALDPGGAVMDAEARGLLAALRRKMGRTRSP